MKNVFPDDESSGHPTSIVPKMLVFGVVAVVAVCIWRFGLPRYRAWQEEQNKPPPLRRLEAVKKIPGGTPMKEVVARLTEQVAELPECGIVITEDGAALPSLPDWHPLKLTKYNNHCRGTSGWELKLPDGSHKSLSDIVVTLEVPLGLMEDPNYDTYIPLDIVPAGYMPEKFSQFWVTLAFDSEARLIGRSGFYMSQRGSQNRFLQ